MQTSGWVEPEGLNSDNITQLLHHQPIEEDPWADQAPFNYFL